MCIDSPTPSSLLTRLSVYCVDSVLNADIFCIRLLLLSHRIEIEPELLEQLKKMEAEGVLSAERDDIAGAINKFSEVINLCPTYASGYNNR